MSLIRYASKFLKHCRYRKPKDTLDTLYFSDSVCIAIIGKLTLNSARNDVFQYVQDFVCGLFCVGRFRLKKKNEITRFVGRKNKTSNVMSHLGISFYFAWNNPKL